MKHFLRHLVIIDYYLAALLLVAAGVSKIITPGVGDLLETLLEQEIITLDQLIFLSRWYPPIEVVFGITALTGIRAVVFARLTGVLYLFFIVLFLIASKGYLLLPVDCGCFGDGDPLPVYLLILRNALIALPLFFFPSDRGCSTRPRLLFTQN
ncbi:MAG: hypothetical protein HY789_01290 [Deltaproteobacteria bacterium]|nr:hypothetical protein [Deltaproteobacteria bacterium]